MKRLSLTFLFIVFAITALAQGKVKGKILDKQTDEALQFVNVTLKNDAGKMVKGVITDAVGYFSFSGLKDGRYELQVSYVGYKTETRQVVITPEHRQRNFNALYLSEDSKMLAEVKVTGQRS